METSREMLLRYQGDPVTFVRERLGFEFWSRQAALAEAVRDHRRVACRSANGVGKTSALARIVLWWLAVWPESIVVTTSATWALVREQLWREIAAAYIASNGFFGDAVLNDTRLELGPQHFAIGLSTDTAERFSGFHSERLLVVLDEASGVPEDVWEAAETLITSPQSRLVAVGNPTRVATSFHRAFTTERDQYKTLSISALDCPPTTGEPVSEAALAKLVGSEWIESRRKVWGERSPLWQVRVLGDFPSTTDDTVCALEDVEAARTRELEPGWPLVISVDVARFGSDLTVLVVRRGNVARVEKVYGGRDLMRTTGEVSALARALQHEHGRKPLVVVDDAGLGGGVTDRLKELGEFKVIGYLGARAASAPRDYPNRRSEDWFGFAEALGLLDLDADEELAADLLAPRYVLDSAGRRTVERKAETKKRLRRSPDRADAIVMAFSVDRPGRSKVNRGKVIVPHGRIQAGRGTSALVRTRFGRPDGLAGISAQTGIRVYDRAAALAARDDLVRRGGGS